MNSEKEILTRDCIPDEMPTKRRWLWSPLGRFLLWIRGWKVVGRMPNEKKVVFLGAPHTSNWDFLNGMSAMMAINLRANWFGKASLFKPPVDKLLRRWGGIPIDRSKNHNVVQQLADAFAKADKMYLGLSPEGTREKVERWKTGFYQIAKAAQVPVLLVYFDYSKKHVGIGPLMQLTDDMEADIQRMKDFFKDKVGKIPAYGVS